jgi:DNA-binding CsgD family transcriptional regulator
MIPSKRLPNGLVRPLTRRQADICRLLAIGLDGPEIAQQLHIGIDAVRMHVNNIADLLENPRLLTPMRLARQWAIAQVYNAQGRDPFGPADPTS